MWRGEKRLESECEVQSFVSEANLALLLSVVVVFDVVDRLLH